MSSGVESMLTVNGDQIARGGLGTVGALLSHLKIVPGRVVVELNGVIYRRGEGLNQALEDGDVVEIVHFVGGG